MRLWWSRTKEADTVQEEPVVSEATRARVQAERDLADTESHLMAVKDQTPAVMRMAERLYALRAPNHLARDIESVMRGKR